VSHNGVVLSDAANCSDAAPPSARGDWTPHQAVGEGDPATDRACFWVQNETVCAYEVGLPGYDVATCGLPMTREEHVRATDTRVLFFMKTYLRTPLVDGLIRDALRERTWDLVVTSGGEWGKMKERSAAFFPEGVNATHDQLAWDFLRDVLVAPRGGVPAHPRLAASERDAATEPRPELGLVVHRFQNHGYKSSTRALGAVASRVGLPVLNDKGLMAALREHDRGFRKQHGFEGPYTEASVRVILAAACEPLVAS